MKYNQFNRFGINLNARHANGVTLIDLAVNMYDY